MGSQGYIATIPLEKLTFEDIREKLLVGIESYIDTNNYDEGMLKRYFDIYEFKSLGCFLSYFSSKISESCPDESEIVISGESYRFWGGKRVPTIIGYNLVLYESDLQFEYQNIPVEYLSEFIENQVEIHT